jgi:hypothetical protein
MGQENASEYSCADCGRPIRNLKMAWICQRLNDDGVPESALIDSECAATMHMQGFALSKPDAQAEEIMLEETQESKCLNS